MVLVLVWLFRPQASARSIPKNREIAAILLRINLLNPLSKKNFIGVTGKYVVRANYSFHSMQIQHAVKISGIRVGDFSLMDPWGATSSLIHTWVEKTSLKKTPIRAPFPWVLTGWTGFVGWPVHRHKKVFRLPLKHTKNHVKQEKSFPLLVFYGRVFLRVISIDCEGNLPGNPRYRPRIKINNIKYLILNA